MVYNGRVPAPFTQKMLPCHNRLLSTLKEFTADFKLGLKYILFMLIPYTWSEYLYKKYYCNIQEATRKCALSCNSSPLRILYIRTSMIPPYYGQESYVPDETLFISYSHPPPPPPLLWTRDKLFILTSMYEQPKNENYKNE